MKDFLELFLFFFLDYTDLLLDFFSKEILSASSDFSVTQGSKVTVLRLYFFGEARYVTLLTS